MRCFICIARVTPGTIKIASGKTYENARQPHKGGFPLKAVKNLTNIKLQLYLLIGRPASRAFKNHHLADGDMFGVQPAGKLGI